MSPTLAIVILLVLTRVATVNTKKLTCSITRTFIATEDHVLSGHTLSTHQVYSLPECHTLCLDHPRCLSYNFQATSISSRNFCEINDATGKMCPQDLARSTGYKYYEDKVIGWTPSKISLNQIKKTFWYLWIFWTCCETKPREVTWYILTI